MVVQRYLMVTTSLLLYKVVFVGASLQNLAAEAYRGESVVFFNRRSIGGICVQVARRGRRQKSRRTMINRCASHAQGNRPTNDTPRRLRQPSTGIPQLTNLLDDFGDQVPG